MKKRENLLKNLFEIVFTVLITLAAQFIILAVGYWNNNKKFNGIFQSPISILHSALIICISVVVIMIISKQFIANRDNQIIILKAQLEEKQRHLELTSNALYGKYGEIAQNNYISMFRTLLQSFLTSNDLVESIQIYKYHFINKNYKSSTRNYNQVAIKVEYLIGLAKEGVDINALMQTYFEVDFDVFMNLQIIKQYYEKVLEYKNDLKGIEYKEIKNHFIDDCYKLVERLLEKLNKITDINKIRDKHFTYYRICLILSGLLGNIDKLDTTDNLIGIQIPSFLNEQITNILISHKRTGILGSIFLENKYTFMNDNSKNKQQRVYLTNIIDFKGEKFVVLFTLPPADWSNKIEWDETLSKISNEFEKKYKSFL